MSFRTIFVDVMDNFINRLAFSCNSWRILSISHNLSDISITKVNCNCRDVLNICGVASNMWSINTYKGLWITWCPNNRLSHKILHTMLRKVSSLNMILLCLTTICKLILNCFCYFISSRNILCAMREVNFKFILRIISLILLTIKAVRLNLVTLTFKLLNH